MPAMFGPATSVPGFGGPAKQLDHHVLAAAEMRAPAEVDRVRRGDGLLGELNIAVRDDQQIVFGAGLLPIAADGDLAVQLPAHQPADLRPVEVQRLIELEHGAAGRFEDDRLAEALGLVFGRAFVGEDDRAGVDLHAAVGQSSRTSERAAWRGRFRAILVFLQFPGARRKEPCKLLQPQIDQFAGQRDFVG